MLVPEPKSILQLEDRAADARAILNSPLFQEMVDGLKKTYISNLISAEVGSADATSAHAGLKVLEDFKASLESVVNDLKMRQHRR